MEILQLNKTDFTPGVSFNPASNELVFEGVSRPENASEFYSQIIDWVVTYESSLYKNHVLASKKFDVHITFKFSYFNSASSKMIYQLLESVKRISMMGYKIIINWYSEEGDDQMLEDGEELSEALDIPFNFFETRNDWGLTVHSISFRLGTILASGYYWSIIIIVKIGRVMLILFIFTLFL